MKIRLEYEVPVGKYCSVSCDNRDMFKPCSHLMCNGYCSLLGVKPIMDSKEHMVILNKLRSCVSAGIQE